ncbi:MAG: hypothetical protein KBS86_01370 [Proteobacteria bacterium]|nr:hypothetical protein [Candidatus Enterousia scatequi]
MRKLFSFLSGIILIGLTIGLLVVACATYDMMGDAKIKPYFFQPTPLSQRRVEAPKTISDLGDTAIRNMLVYKYINEYFYVVPNPSDIETRIKGQYSNGMPTALRGMSTKSAFDYWVQHESKTIQDLSSKGIMRTIDVKNITVGATGHLIVDYELKTWFTANDMYAVPVTTRGRIYMDVRYTPGIQDDWTALRRLEHGMDAASVFKFMVVNVEQE